MENAEFDYIVVGSGSSGSVVANRLSADPAIRVCLLEAGPSDRELITGFKTRLPIGSVMLLPSARTNWGYFFKGGEALGNRDIPSHRGRMSGGSSSVNGMVYMRGLPRDYDEWGAQGNPGWSWADVLPVFKKQENREAGSNAWHGVGGELNVASLRTQNPVTKAFLTAAEETQFRRNDDFNGSEQDGFGPWEVTQKNGQRWNSTRAFIHPVLQRKNLHIINDCQTLRITFENRRATGVVIAHRGAVSELKARREIILSSGAYNSPKLLMLSGIGDTSALMRHGITALHHLPGVGANLQDHPAAWIEYEDPSGESAALNLRTLPRYTLAALQYIFLNRGPLTSNAVEAGGFIRTDSRLDHPDIQYVFMPAKRAPGQYMPRMHGFTLMAVLLRPKSRGWMELASSDPAAKPVLHPNFLADSEDTAAMVRGTQTGRRILAAPAMARYCGRETAPGPDVQSFDEIESYIRASIMTSYHPVGTCKMAPASDPGSVVDERLRVRGLDALRVIDSSIMPAIIGGNTNAPSMMIGERGAGFILEDAKR